MDRTDRQDAGDDPDREAERQTGLGWEEFFHWLGQGTGAAARQDRKEQG